jgi:LysM repeat protein
MAVAAAATISRPDRAPQMETPESSNARLAAVIALLAAFVVVVVIVASSLGGGGSGKGASNPGSTTRSAASKSSERRRKIYVVKPGDTLSAIANKVGSSIEDLQRLNPRLDQFSLHSGDRVKLR